MSRSPPINPGPLRQCNALMDEEELMLDDLEKSTGRLYQSASNMKEESHVHNRLLEGMDRDAEETAESLYAEARNVDRVRQAKKGVCWMYLVIAIEAGVLVCLIYMGLS